MSKHVISPAAAVAYAEELLAGGLQACEKRLAADPLSNYAFEDFTQRMCWADGISLLLARQQFHGPAAQVDAAVDLAVQQAREMCARARESAAGPADGEGGAS